LKLGEALTNLVRELGVLGVEYAVVGGLAASALGEVRFTRDVDVAVAVRGDQEAERLVFELRGLGYEVLATVEQEALGRLATARLLNPRGVTCDLIFATCGVEAEVVASAEALEIFPGVCIRTASVESLLAMKTLSATPARPRDLGDIRALLLHHPDFDEHELYGLLEQITERGFARDQILEDKWRRLRSELGA
jgi:hypothetical protein